MSAPSCVTPSLWAPGIPGAGLNKWEQLTNSRLFPPRLSTGKLHIKCPGVMLLCSPHLCNFNYTMAESRTCYMSNIELVSTDDCWGWRDIRFKYQCSCILQFTQHLRISSVLHELVIQVLSILVHPSAAVPHTGALSVCRGRGLERAGSRSNARYVRLRPSLI